MGIFNKIKKLFKTDQVLEKQEKKIDISDVDLSKTDTNIDAETEIVQEAEEVVETEEKIEKETEPAIEVEETIPEKEDKVEVEIIPEIEQVEQDPEAEEIIEEVEKAEEDELEEDEVAEAEIKAEQEEIKEELETEEVVIEEVPEVIEVIEKIEVKQAPKKTKKQKLDAGLKKTKESFFGKLARTVAGKSTIDELALDDIEEALITSDIGVETTLKIIGKLEEKVAKDKYINTTELNDFLKAEISLLMKEGYDEIPKVDGPYVIMVVGVNGVGKTTTIGKLAHQFKQQGKKVVLGAADTFRAAAVDQLVIWADRVGVEIVKQDMGSDPASVCFDTLQSAKASGADVVIIDTAGRLHNKINLMNELTKIKNVMAKVIPEAPHDVMLVLDASTGQNAIEQATQFTKATEVNSLALTKLDGTAKGGVVIGISDQFQIPVRYIGVGEGVEDLQVFNKNEFVDSLFN